jgi:hypothetical protein
VWKTIPAASQCADRPGSRATPLRSEAPRTVVMYMPPLEDDSEILGFREPLPHQVRRAFFQTVLPDEPLGDMPW